MYIENPKTKGSGIICCIPQKGTCPHNCTDCFFQSGRSYLEPLDKNLPNMPPVELAKTHVVRVNDGNDSSVNINTVMEATKDFPFKFYNTSSVAMIDKFDAPVVLTVNPGLMTDNNAYLLNIIPENLMFVRVRVNMWNASTINIIVDHYTKANICVVLTFMAYFCEDVPNDFKQFYTLRKRTLNSYWAITTEAWETVMNRYKYNNYVYSCGIEGEKGTSKCSHCGNCLRLYFACIEKMNSI